MVLFSWICLVIVVCIGEIAAKPANPQTVSADDLEKILWRGIDAMYRYEFAMASSSLDSVMLLDPTGSVAPFVSVANEWLRALTEEGYRESHLALRSSIDRTIPVYEAISETDDQRADIMLYLGSTYGLRARIALAEKKWLSVITSGWRGMRLVQEAHAADSTLADIYLPLGIFDYYSGISSTSTQILARMVGMHPDHELGIRELTYAADHAKYAWIEASSALAIIFLYIENDTEKALIYIRRLVRRYPENYYFRLLNGEALVKAGRYLEARNYIDDLEELFTQAHPNQQLEWQLKLSTLKGSLAFQTGHYEEALKHCQSVIDHYDMEFDWHLGIAYFTRAQIHEQNGDLDNALNDYRFVIRLDNKTYVVEEAAAAVTRLQ